jgi:hypothetical protein
MYEAFFCDTYIELGGNGVDVMDSCRVRFTSQRRFGDGMFP